MKTNNTYKTIKVIFLLSACLISSISFAHWNSQGPFGGSVSCMHTADSITYVGTNGGGIFNLKNGIKWAVGNAGLTSGNITSLTTIGSYVIAGTPNEGIFLSKDLGKTWTQVNAGLGSIDIRALTTVDKYLYAGTADKGIFISADSGNTWTGVNTGLNNKKMLCLTSYSGILLAGTDGGGIYASSNNGGTWTAINTGLQNLVVKTITVSANEILAGTSSGVYKASVSVPVWSAANTGLPLTAINSLYYNSGLIYACTNNGLYTSGESVSWTSASLGLTADTVTSITTLQSKLFAGTKTDGIFSSLVSNLNWQKAIEGFSNLTVKALAIKGIAIVGATNKGVYYKADEGASYTPRNKDLIDSLLVSDLAFDGTSLYATALSGKIYVSPDTGKTWTSVSTGLNGDPIVKIAVGDNKNFIATSTGKVFYTDKANVQWTETSSGLPTNAKITALITDGVDAYLAAEDEGVYKLTPGAEWKAFSNGLSDLKLTCLTISNETIFAGTNGSGIFSSQTHTDSWLAINEGLPSLSIFSIGVSTAEIDKISYTYLFAGIKGKVYCSSNNGLLWESTSVQANIPAYADIISIGFSDNRIYVGTPNNSIYANKKSDSELPAPRVSSILSKGKTDNLFAIYPNPGRDSFKINYADKRDKIKNITVYDFSGKVINSSNSADQTLNIEGPQGTYFINIETEDGKTSTEKLIIQQ